MIKRILLVILIVGMTFNLFSEPLTSNSITYDTENLDGTLILRTTENNTITLLQNESDLPLISISPTTREKLRVIINKYIEMDDVAIKSNYRTSIPPSMRSDDYKVIQFRMIHKALDDETIIYLVIDMENYREYQDPIIIRFSLEQLSSFLLTLDEGFTYMDSLRMEVIKLRKMESEI